MDVGERLYHERMVTGMVDPSGLVAQLTADGEHSCEDFSLARNLDLADVVLLDAPGVYPSHIPRRQLYGFHQALAPTERHRLMLEGERLAARAGARSRTPAPARLPVREPPRDAAVEPAASAGEPSSG